MRIRVDAGRGGRGDQLVVGRLAEMEVGVAVDHRPRVLGGRSYNPAPMPRYLITSALPYINGVKHLGNLVGSMLPADVYARFLRPRGEEVLYVCATDEHGTPAELAAAEAGLEVAEYCREQHEVQARVCAEFGLSFDVFGRSSSVAEPGADPAVRAAPGRAGPDRGARRPGRCTRRPTGASCPTATSSAPAPTAATTGRGATSARTAPACSTRPQLIEPRSAISGSRDLEVRESRHLFLLQSKLAGPLREWLEAKDDWPVLARSIGLKWLDEGLEDRSITRDLKWGVPGRPAGVRGQGLLRVVRRPARVHRGDARVGRRARRAGRVAAVVVRGRRRPLRRSSWPRTTSPSTRSASRR